MLASLCRVMAGIAVRVVPLGGVQTQAGAN
jgi:hypothetical protein